MWTARDLVAVGSLSDHLVDVTTTAPMYDGLQESRGRLQVGTPVTSWGLLPMLLGRTDRAS